MLQSDLISILGGNFKRAGNEQHGPCPFCGGRDRFIIFADARYWCRQCQRSGDAVQLLRDLHGLTYAQACERLGITPTPQAHRPKTVTARPRSNGSQQPPPAPAPRISTPRQAAHDQAAWQQAAQALAQRAKDVLHAEPAGAPGRDYLASRGISRYAACCHHIGYIPTDYSAVWGGLPVKISSGLMIAWQHPLEPPYKLNVRRLDGRQPKYLMVTGSTNGLYNAWRIQRGRSVILCEGEIDAISVFEGTQGRFFGVATGSTTGGRTAHAIARLAQAAIVFVAFDADPPGDEAAQWWMRTLPNARRLKPTRHDINAMLQAGDSIDDWIATGF